MRVEPAPARPAVSHTLPRKFKCNLRNTFWDKTCFHKLQKSHAGVSPSKLAHEACWSVPSKVVGFLDIKVIKPGGYVSVIVKILLATPLDLSFQNL